MYLKQFGDYKRVDTVSEVLNKLTAKGFGFNKGAKEVYVVRDDLDFLTNKHLEENITTGESKNRNSNSSNNKC